MPDIVDARCARGDELVVSTLSRRGASLLNAPGRLPLS